MLCYYKWHKNSLIKRFTGDVYRLTRGFWGFINTINFEFLRICNKTNFTRFSRNYRTILLHNIKMCKII